jgi:hypothetical protein
MKSGKMLLVILLLTGSLYALEEMGFKAGIGTTTLSGSDANNASLQIGFSAGVYANARLNEWLSFQPELLLSRRGATVDGTERVTTDNDYDGMYDEDPFDGVDNDGDGLLDEDRPEPDFSSTGNYTLYYLELPLLLKARITQLGSGRLHLLAGPSVNILLDGSYRYETAYGSDLEGDLDNLNAVDLSALMAAQYSVGRMCIELRATHSLTTNSFTSNGEALLEDDPDLFLGTAQGLDYHDYTRFTKIEGANFGITLLMGVRF